MSFHRPIRSTASRSVVTIGLFAIAAPSLFAAATPPAAPAAPNAVQPCTFAPGTSPVTAVLRVADLSDAVLPQAAVEVRCGHTVLNGITDGRGELTLTLRPGRYTVLTREPGFADTVRTLDLPAATSPAQIAMAVGSATDVINVSADTGFVPFASNAGSKTDALLVEVPQSISIVNERELQDRGVLTMNEALRYTPGVTADEYGVEDRFDWLKIRGFDAQTFGVYRDGMRFNSLSGKLDPFELESVEILKGPSSVLYGEAPPGGLINQVTKRPSAERSTELQADFGSFNRREGRLDTTGALDHNQVWRYRLLGLVRDSGTQVNYTPDNRRLVAPELAWQPSDRTDITVLADYQHDRTAWDQFLPAEGTLYSSPTGPIPINTFLGEPGFDNVNRNQGSIAYTADHLFTDGWDVHSNYRYQYINLHAQTIAGDGLVAGSTTTVARYLFATPNVDRINTTDNRALRRFGIGREIEQTVLFGYDYQRLDAHNYTFFDFGLGNLNVYNPVYGQTPIPNSPPSGNEDSVLNQHGLYAQDQIKIKQHLIFTLGGRQDFANNAVANFIAGQPNYNHTDDRFTGRVGVTYLTTAGLAPYFAFSTSFLPNAGTYVYDSATGIADKPAVASDARQIEGGLKFQPHTWTGFLTASVFQINETNVLVPNTAFTDYQAGEVRSRGVELEGVADVARGLNLHASYTFTATDDQNDVQAQNIGKWLPQTPRNQLAALADYTVGHGRFNGLGGNFGVRFVGTNAADSVNSFFIPNYALLDGSLRFGYRHTLFQVNATNLTDKRYVATCISTASCCFGYVRNVTGTATYRF